MMSRKCRGRLCEMARVAEIIKVNVKRNEIKKVEAKKIS
jgi:hypothetical protein